MNTVQTHFSVFHLPQLDRSWQLDSDVPTVYKPTRQLCCYSDTSILCLPSVARSRLVRDLFLMLYILSGTVVWNSLPRKVRSSKTLTSFKSSWKSHFFKLSYQLPPPPHVCVCVCVCVRACVCTRGFVLYFGSLLYNVLQKQHIKQNIILPLCADRDASQLAMADDPVQSAVSFATSSSSKLISQWAVSIGHIVQTD